MLREVQMKLENGPQLYIIQDFISSSFYFKGIHLTIRTQIILEIFHLILFLTVTAVILQ